MKRNVLVFPCGSEIGLEIYRSLRFTKDFKVFGASSVDDHGKFVYENYISNIPFVNDSNFINHINKVVADNNIDFIFPAYDSVVLKLAQNSEQLDARVVTSPVSTCETTRSKSKTYQLLKQVVKTPAMYSSSNNLSFPVFLKPDVGQGSKGTQKANTSEEVNIALEKNSDLLILEYLPGDEYTIDCFTDKKGSLLFSQARQRNRVSNGISVNSKIVDNSEFKSIAMKINSVLDLCGVWFFQLKKDKQGRLTLLEVAPRVAGTMALSRMKGVNLPLLSLYDALGIDIEVSINDFDVEIDRALTSKYKLSISYDTVYIDFDDTIIMENRANYLIVALLYKFLEEKKRIILITKHLKEIKKTLVKHKISKNIFDQIISLNKEEDKSNYISGKAIFIDDSFSERKAVHKKTGIPVFDVGEAVGLL